MSHPSNPEFHSCPTCGYTWRHGQHGGHNCSTLLLQKIRVLREALEAISKDSAGDPAVAARSALLQAPMNQEHNDASLRRGWKELAEAPHPRKGMCQSLGGLIARVSEILEGKADTRDELDYGSGYAFTLRELHRNLKEVWIRRGEPGIVAEFGALYCLDTEDPAQEVEDPEED